MSEYQDRGYAWVVLLAGVFLNVIKATNYMVGVFLVEFQHNLDVSRVAVSWAGGLHLFVGPVCGIFLGPLMQRFGARPFVMGGSLLKTLGFLVPAFFSNIQVIYIFIGIFASLGYMSTYNASIVVIQQYFSRRCALANGLFMTGFSLGWLLLPPLLRLVIDMYGWRAGLMVMAMLALQGVVLGALLRPVPAASLQQEDHSKKAYIQQDSSTVPKSDVLPEKRTITRSLFSNVWFIMFLIGDFAIQMGFRTVMVYTPMRCDLLGLTKSQAAWLMSTVGLAGLVGYPVAGWLADRPRIDRVLLFGIGALLSGVAILSTVAMQDFHTLLSGMLLLSTLVVTSAASIGPVLRTVVGLSHLEVALGVRTTSSGISNILFNITSGYLFDYTGDPNAPFFLFGTIQVAGGVLVSAIPGVKKYIKPHIMDGPEAKEIESHHSNTSTV